MNDINDKIRALFKIGTPACGLSFALIGALLCGLAVGIGIPNTLLIALFALLGLFIGAVRHKLSWLRDLINRLFPPKTEDLSKPEEWKNSKLYRQAQEAMRAGGAANPTRPAPPQPPTDQNK